MYAQEAAFEAFRYRYSSVARYVFFFFITPIASNLVTCQQSMQAAPELRLLDFKGYLIHPHFQGATIEANEGETLLGFSFSNSKGSFTCSKPTHVQWSSLVQQVT